MANPKGKTVKVTSTSRNTAAVDDIELRETTTTRLVFRPLLVNNAKDEEAAIKGSFIFQRKSRTAKWEDYKELDLTRLKAEEWIRLELHSDEVLALFHELRALYELYEQEGIPQGEVSYLRAATGAAALLNASDKDIELLLEDSAGQGQELVLRFLSWFLDRPDRENMLGLLEGLDTEQLGHLSELAGLKALRGVIDIWNANQTNGEEEFWQKSLGANGFVLSQVFPVPVIIVEDKAYVGGKQVTNRGGNIADFLLKNEISQNAILVEIKTPVSPLLSNKSYRQEVFGPSAEITGAIAQALNYRQHLIENAHSLKNPEEGLDFDAFEPTVVIIAGNYIELADRARRRSFELFRAQLRNVQLITYDELFGKVASLMEVLQGTIKDSSQDDDYGVGDWMSNENTPVAEEDDIPF